jgi:hypothetical protein
MDGGGFTLVCQYDRSVPHPAASTRSPKSRFAIQASKGVIVDTEK